MKAKSSSNAPANNAPVERDAGVDAAEEHVTATAGESQRLQVDATLGELLHETELAARAVLALIAQLEQSAPGSDNHADVLIDTAVELFTLHSQALNTHDYIDELIGRLPDDAMDDLDVSGAREPELATRLYWSLGEAARATGLAATTLRNQIHRGRLKAVKIGRNWIVTRASVEEYLASRRINAKPVELRLKRKRRPAFG